MYGISVYVYIYIYKYYVIFFSHTTTISVFVCIQVVGVWVGCKPYSCKVWYSSSMMYVCIEEHWINSTQLKATLSVVIE